MYGGGQWVVEHWWYKLTHVCQRWWNLILGSVSYLGLCLVCTHNTPVADMLAYSPPLPLIVDYQGHDITAEDEEAVILALAQRDRVRRIRLRIPVPKLQKPVTVIDEEYPILEHLILGDPEVKSTVLILPETLQTPRLRHLDINFSFQTPTRVPLFGTGADLIVLSFAMYLPFAYLQPADLIQWLSSMPRLEVLIIFPFVHVSNSNVERQLVCTPITTNITLPNLRTFTFQAVSSYSEAVLSRITASHLQLFEICYFEQLTYFIPQLLQFMGRIENLRFDSAEFFCGERVYVVVNPPGINLPSADFSIYVWSWSPNSQVSSMAQILNTFRQMFSTVEHLCLGYKDDSRSSEEDNEVDRAEWRNLLRSFSNVKTLRIDDMLVGELSRCLRLEDGESPLELLPELQELTYSGRGNTNDAFTPFIDARKSTDRPVTLYRY